MGKDPPLSRQSPVGACPALFFAIALLTAVTLGAVAPDTKIGARLAELCAHSKPGRFVTVLADLKVQVDLNELGKRMSAEGLSRRRRTERVREALASTAAREQDALGSRLEEWKRQDRVRSWRGVRIVNRLILEVRVDAVPELARAGVFSGLWDGERSRPLARRRTRRVGRWAGSEWPPEVRGRNWALDALRVGELWKNGLQGEGVVIGILDSGVDGTHPQLQPNRKKGDAWFDPFEGRPEAWDSSGHGTSVLSAAVSRNRDGYRIGAAPRASWVAALANPRGVFHPKFFTLAADWMLFEGRPDVLLMAFGFEPGECHDDLLPFVNAFRAAEIFCVFAAGNEGPAPGTDISPANYTGLYPGDGEAFAVGGLERDLSPYPGSGSGPAACGERVYPTVVAPAAALPVALKSRELRYDWIAGTSFAAGYGAGAAALCYQASPGILVGELEEVLVSSSRDLGPPGPDRRHGHGLLDLKGAVGRLPKEK